MLQITLYFVEDVKQYLLYYIYRYERGISLMSYYPDALTIAKEITVAAVQNTKVEIYLDESYGKEVAAFLEEIYKKAREIIEER